ncbi:MAG TPA: nicotinate-nucleotide adenylyltransferase [Gemmatimonadales bacterium]|nr:nicotinate-nucleotide adenylyltransferase [Gemmatimonadales bacterium]
MRLGILGGSFDPIHNAHLIVAQSAQEQLGLDRLLFMVSGRQPLKGGHGAPALDRLRMVELGIAGLPGCVADGREVHRGGVSYTIDTLRELRIEHPDAELVLILGSDAVLDLPRWREAAEVARLATMAVVARPGTPREAHAIAVDVPEMAISSTEVRTRAATGRGLRGWVPAAVADYISGLSLYQTPGGAA